MVMVIDLVEVREEGLFETVKIHSSTRHFNTCKGVCLEEEILKAFSQLRIDFPTEAKKVFAIKNFILNQVHYLD